MCIALLYALFCVVAIVVNYVGNRLFVFKSKPQPAEETTQA